MQIFLLLFKTTPDIPFKGKKKTEEQIKPKRHRRKEAIKQQWKLVK